MPYAASKVTYYILSVFVLLAAVTAAGVDLNKFTIITGALGVGVGFGLQDIVKNFASGLILLFERPIRVDDVIELTGMVGTVRRIGARSSTIVTFQGAEVIVPNSNLVSTQVINWTLSSQQRRIEISVGVAYGTDPERVLQLLVAEAAAHENVMTNPAPVAFFIGFGDSALNFELRFWSETPGHLVPAQERSDSRSSQGSHRGWHRNTLPAARPPSAQRRPGNRQPIAPRAVSHSASGDRCLGLLRATVESYRAFYRFSIRWV